MGQHYEGYYDDYTPEELAHHAKRREDKRKRIEKIFREEGIGEVILRMKEGNL